MAPYCRDVRAPCKCDTVVRTGSTVREYVCKGLENSQANMPGGYVCEQLTAKTWLEVNGKKKKEIIKSGCELRCLGRKC